MLCNFFYTSSICLKIASAILSLFLCKLTFSVLRPYFRFGIYETSQTKGMPKAFNTKLHIMIIVLITDVRSQIFDKIQLNEGEVSINSRNYQDCRSYFTCFYPPPFLFTMGKMDVTLRLNLSPPCHYIYFTGLFRPLLN